MPLPICNLVPDVLLLSVADQIRSVLQCRARNRLARRRYAGEACGLEGAFGGQELVEWIRKEDPLGRARVEALVAEVAQEDQVIGAVDVCFLVQQAVLDV